MSLSPPRFGSRHPSKVRSPGLLCLLLLDPFSFPSAAKAKDTMKAPSLLNSSLWLLALLQASEAFTTTTPATASSRLLSTTALQAASRRGVLGKIRGAVVGAATLAVFRQGPQIALAEDMPDTSNGRVVELTVANLDGVPGKTGTVKIQLRPEWAPRGVKRFEVCRTEFAIVHMPSATFTDIPVCFCFL